MNKRQRKKLYLKKTGKNPPCGFILQGDNYNKIVGITKNIKRPYCKPVIFEIVPQKINMVCEREVKIQNIITRLIDLLDQALKSKSYKINTEHVVNLAKVLTRRRKI